MIKYLGSKRALLPAIMSVVECLAPHSALDLFTGTTRVGQALKRNGIETTVNDIASYSKIFGDCYVATDAREIEEKELAEALSYLQAVANKHPHAGYVTEVFCQSARYFQPKNGQRIDTIRETIESDFSGHPFYPILLTALIEAADRVDSTTGVQMAYLKKWSARSYKDLKLRTPELLPGIGHCQQADALSLCDGSDKYDLVYIDPPYNQHRYFTNYHIWETLVRWDKPEHYGVACKRIDSKSDTTKSIYNRKREMPNAFKKNILQAPGKSVLISYNNESWVSISQIEEWVRQRYQNCLVLDFEYKRYVGAQIGIYNPDGEKVGDVSHVKNREYLIIGADREQIKRVQSLA